jgi:hypothetical protein
MLIYDMFSILDFILHMNGSLDIEGWQQRETSSPVMLRIV